MSLDMLQVFEGCRTTNLNEITLGLSAVQIQNPK